MERRSWGSHSSETRFNGILNIEGSEVWRILARRRFFESHLKCKSAGFCIIKTATRAWEGEDLHQPHNQLNHCSTSRAIKISERKALNPFHDDGDDNDVKPERNNNCERSMLMPSKEMEANWKHLEGTIIWIGN